MEKRSPEPEEIKEAKFGTVTDAVKSCSMYFYHVMIVLN